MTRIFINHNCLTGFRQRISIVKRIHDLKSLEQRIDGGITS